MWIPILIVCSSLNANSCAVFSSTEKVFDNEKDCLSAVEYTATLVEQPLVKPGCIQVPGYAV
jgi:hypothetical protein